MLLPCIVLSLSKSVFTLAVMVASSIVRPAVRCGPDDEQPVTNVPPTMTSELAMIATVFSPLFILILPPLLNAASPSGAALPRKPNPYLFANTNYRIHPEGETQGRVFLARTARSPIDETGPRPMKPGPGRDATFSRCPTRRVGA